ncbi:hypothetical protein MBLNU459_g1940t1 [Dothideomycetes sp. NU459]
MPAEQSLSTEAVDELQPHLPLCCANVYPPAPEPELETSVDIAIAMNRVFHAHKALDHLKAKQAEQEPLLQAMLKPKGVEAVHKHNETEVKVLQNKVNVAVEAAIKTAGSNREFVWALVVGMLHKHYPISYHDDSYLQQQQPPPASASRKSLPFPSSSTLFTETDSHETERRKKRAAGSNSRVNPLNAYISNLIVQQELAVEAADEIMIRAHLAVFLDPVKY